ncbi:endoplasmic oxidoreductin [Ascobolus immersus RN42]|uniref:Endoplasmic oxidoreductin n=1 Tax=Ascobolus immersus RN42 TaxID=1160509 RepID=A0A3N4ISU2_ASCIM|nr:endoplasmic oxidoreductin [Ascobolus immersus RN42]
MKYRYGTLIAGSLLVNGLVNAEEWKPLKGACTFDHSAQIFDACPTYGNLDNLNAALRPHLKDLTRNLDYFSYYRLNLFKECPFWSDDGMCGNIGCAVKTIDDEKDIPLIWRKEELAKLEGPKFTSDPAANTGPATVGCKGQKSPLGGKLGSGKDESCIIENDDWKALCDEKDYCLPEDVGAKAEYVSLKENPERFTGYAGTSANQVWEAIYRENCFARPEEPSGQSRMPFSPFQKVPGLQAEAAGQLRNVLHQQVKNEVHSGGQLGDLNVEEECLEKRVFYKIVSGMHASISMHLCWDYLNQTTGEWGPNLDCFINRFTGHPERIQNIYFNYALVLRALTKLRTTFGSYTFCPGDFSQDRLTQSKLLGFTKLALANAPSPPKSAPEHSPKIFDESVMFASDSTISLKDEFRDRFRNISRIMDCVGCDKCRLWGKVQTQGYGTALKVLFEFDENLPAGVGQNPKLRRTELVALVNTLDRLGDSLNAALMFQKQVEARDEEEKKRKEEEEKRANIVPTTIWEDIINEIDVVYQAYVAVLKTFWYMPKIIWHLITTESKRAWLNFIGLDPGPRLWDLGAPAFEPTKKIQKLKSTTTSTTTEASGLPIHDDL